LLLLGYEETLRRETGSRPRGRSLSSPSQEPPMSTEEEQKRALKAFKKKLKLARLDDESRLGKPGGNRSGIMGITPPPGHPPDVWESLVKAGKLRREMSGTYSVIEGS
jgi:hypothetical protein